MLERHLLNLKHFADSNHLHFASPGSSNVKLTTIMGVQTGLFYALCGGLVIIITLCCCIFVAARRRRTLQDYNENPERFPNLPDLTFMQQRHLKSAQFTPLIQASPSALVIEKKTDDYAGPYYKVIFKGKQAQAVIFELEQKSKHCYFQMEVLSLQGEVEIGFAQVQTKDKIKAKQQSIGTSGVSLSTSGFVVTNGENIYNYNWSLNHGDVIGLGITKESDKFNERRAWISKNGVLLNPPPHEELDKWLSTVNISAQEREKFGKEKGKQETGQEYKDAEAADKAAEAAQAAFEKEQAQLASQRVQMKTFKSFNFYPIVYFQGIKNNNANDGKQKVTAVVINVGGQVFRMQQSDFRGGILT